MSKPHAAAWILRLGSALGLLLSAGCGREGAAVEAWPRPAETAPRASLPVLPRPGELARTAAYVEPGLQRSGAGYSAGLPLSRVARDGSRAVFTPDFAGAGRGPAGLSYAVYVFEAEDYDRQAVLHLDWQAAPANGLFVGLADFAADRWRWLPAAADAVALPGLDDCFDPDGRLYVAVLLAATDPARLNSLRLGSAPPVPVLLPLHSQGPLPLAVDFELAATDPDGTIARYELDYEGDGVYDFDSAAAPAGTLHYSYAAAGAYYPRLRVTDDAGTQAVVEADVLARLPGGSSPSASMSYLPLTGEVPLLVVLDASASTDADGSVVDYAFDLDNDGSFELHGPAAAVHHVYPDAGTFPVHLRVTDDTGLSSSSTYFPGVTATDPENAAPTAQLAVVRTGSAFPETFQFDAAGSADLDGTIVRYEWDFDGDGGFEENSGTVPVVTHAYHAAGLYTPAVRVTDNDTAQAVTAAAQPLEVTAGWTRRSVATQANGQSSSLALTIDGLGVTRLGLAFAGATTPVAYASADPADLAAWSPPVAVSAENCTARVALLEVADAPAVFYQRAGGTGTGGLSYVRALDGAGTMWGLPANLDNTGAGVARTVRGLLVGGRPAVCFGASSSGRVRYLRASDGLGLGWPAASTVLIDALDETLGLALFEVNGNPACAAVQAEEFGGGDLDFIRALDPEGAAWPALPLPLGEAGSLPVGTLGALTVDLLPALAYSYYAGLTFRRAADANGAAWGEPQVLHDNGYLDDAICLLDNGGKPAVCFHNYLAGVVFIPALDSAGTAWGSPEVIDSAGEVGTGCSALRVGNSVVVSYFDLTNGQLKVAYRAME